MRAGRSRARRRRIRRRLVPPQRRVPPTRPAHSRGCRGQRIGLPDEKEGVAGFTTGDIPFLVTKPSIGAWGLNWQHSHRMTYLRFPSHSYEQWYQAVRRMWRFGQTRPVRVDVITTEGGRNVLANLRRKADQADAMFTALVEHA